MPGQAHCGRRRDADCPSILSAGNPPRPPLHPPPTRPTQLAAPAAHELYTAPCIAPPTYALPPYRPPTTPPRTPPDPPSGGSLGAPRDGSSGSRTRSPPTPGGLLVCPPCSTRHGSRPELAAPCGDPGLPPPQNPLRAPR